MIITAAQLRAARGLLDWTRTDLAKAANISPETVKNIEHGTFRPQEQTADAIIKAFGTHDVVFTENEGVQIKRDYVTRYEGDIGLRKFVDEIYAAAKELGPSPDHDKHICVSNVDDRLFAKHLGDYLPGHLRRMNELKGTRMRVLIQEKPHTLLPEEQREAGYREYRRFGEQHAGNVPFYVYGEKLAVLIFEDGQEPHIVIITSAMVSKAYREQFEIMWDIAKPLEMSRTAAKKLLA